MLGLRLRCIAAVVCLRRLGALRPHLARLLIAISSRSSADATGRPSDGSLTKRALRTDGLGVWGRSHHHLWTLRRNNAGLGYASSAGVRRVRWPASGNSRVGRCSNGLLAEGGLSRLLVWPAPDTLKVVVAHITLLVHRSVEVGGVMGLRMDFHQRGGPGLILVRGSGDLLSGAALDDTAVVPGSAVTEVWSNR